MSVKDDEIAEEIFWISVAVSILGMVGILAWEFFQYLKLGKWPDNEFSAIFLYLGVNLDSIYYPTNWIGVAKIIRWFLGWPVSLATPVFGSALGWILGEIVQGIVVKIKGSLK